MAKRWCSAWTASPDFNALHSRQHDEEVQLYAFDILALDGEDLRGLPLSLRKTKLARLLARRPDGVFVAPFEQGEIGPDLFRAACNMGLERIGIEAAGSALSGWTIEALDQGEEPEASCDEPGDAGIRLSAASITSSCRVLLRVNPATLRDFRSSDTCFDSPCREHAS
jgi:hypothetical protein